MRVVPLLLRLPSLSPGAIVILGAGAYAVVMGFIVVTRHLAIRTHALDLGYYVQVVWSIASGYGPYVTFPPMHAWGDHLSPVLYLLVPVAWIAPGAIGLVIVQTLVLAAGAFAVYGYAARRLGAVPAAAALTLLFLVNPSLHGINLRDIHPQAFAITLIIAAALAFDAGRYAWCAAALALTLACREDAAVAVVGFGIWLAVARGRWRLGALVAAASVLLLAVDVMYVMPYFRGESYSHLQRYTYLGSSLGDILLSIAVRPWRWIGIVLTGSRLVYLVLMLAPLGFLSLLAPRVLLAAVPGLAMNLLSVDPVLFNVRSQYQSFVLPFLVLAAIDGYTRIREWRRAPALLGFAFVASMLLTGRTTRDLMVSKWRLDPEDLAAYALMRQIPPDAAVSVNERLAAHLATRRQIFVYPTGLGLSEYVLDIESVLGRDPARGYRELARDSGWILLRRD